MKLFLAIAIPAWGLVSLLAPGEAAAQVCNQTSAMERAACTMQLAIESGDASMCDGLSDIDSTECYERIARSTGISHCGNIGYEFARDDCETYAEIGWQERLAREAEEQEQREYEAIEREQLAAEQAQTALLDDQLAVEQEQAVLLDEHLDAELALREELLDLREENLRLREQNLRIIELKLDAADARGVLSGDGDEGEGNGNDQGNEGGGKDEDSTPDVEDEGGDEGDFDAGFEDDGFEDEDFEDEGAATTEPSPAPTEPPAR